MGIPPVADEARRPRGWVVARVSEGVARRVARVMTGVGLPSSGLPAGVVFVACLVPLASAAVVWLRVGWPALGLGALALLPFSLWLRGRALLLGLRLDPDLRKLRGIVVLSDSPHWRDFNPAVIVLCGLGNPLVYRFYAEFQHAKHRDTDGLQRLEAHLFAAVSGDG